MQFDHNHYIPCLRWKQGEYQAIYNLKSETKKMITPLIEVAEMNFDFEKRETVKTIDEHIITFTKNVQKKWGTEKCFIDANIIDKDERMNDSTHYVNSIFNALIENRINCTAVTCFDRDKDYNDAILQLKSKHNLNLCFRLNIKLLAKKDFNGELENFLNFFLVSANETDMIIDLETLNDIPVEGFSKALSITIQKFPHLNEWKTFTIIGTSFPKTMTEVKPPIDYKPRHEWILYKKLLADLEHIKTRIPTFGDYTICHPDIMLGDMRLYKPSANIRYTIDDEWCIIKGKTVRTKNGFQQFHDLCNTLIKLPVYAGAGFSYGDNFIKQCANKNGKCGNLSTWRTVGTNHHIEKVVSEISNLFDSSNNI